MISIIVPCYNAEELLGHALESLKNQTDPDYQIVLVDDGSTDSTPSLCDRAAEENGKIKVVHQANKGLMGAWKTGVRESNGEYIAFCDADDYMDSDLVLNVSRIIEKYTPDLIAFGLTAEYSNGDRIKSYNRIPEGLYEEAEVKRDILPRLFSDGDMQSELILKSRWTKVFRKDILTAVMPDLNEMVSLGEDQVTVFAVMQVIKTLYCMGEYAPYHYIRHSTSMIGRFDHRIFEKVDLLYREMNAIADIYEYHYRDQLLCDQLSVTLIYIKKYICKSDEGYLGTRAVINDIRESEGVRKCLHCCSVNGYNIGSRLFAELFIRRAYIPLYYFTRIFERIRGRNV